MRNSSNTAINVLNRYVLHGDRVNDKVVWFFDILLNITVIHHVHHGWIWLRRMLEMRFTQSGSVLFTIYVDGLIEAMLHVNFMPHLQMTTKIVWFILFVSSSVLFLFFCSYLFPNPNKCSRKFIEEYTWNSDNEMLHSNGHNV